MFFTSWISNSFEDDASSSAGRSIPKNNNNYHFRDSSSDSSDGEMTVPTTPTSQMSPISSIFPLSQSNGTTLNNINNNNHNTPNLQRRASESITVAEAVQFEKLPVRSARRYTLPGKLGLPLSRFWEPGRDSSVQVAMDHCQFGL